MDITSITCRKNATIILAKHLQQCIHYNLTQNSFCNGSEIKIHKINKIKSLPLSYCYQGS